MAPTPKPTFEEWLAVSELAFEWAESYDSKDWTRLRSILAPTLTIDYDKVNNSKFLDLPADRFVEMMKDPLFLGDSNIDSQHMLGLTKWEKKSDDEIVSHSQSRAAHVRWEEGRKEVAAKGHGHGVVTTTYRKVDGEWKWAGIKTLVRWNEYEFEKVFRGAAGKFD
ncbi:Scytalone dehydratase [Aspergillus avenaceus]|uniref:Scytalone dehydratase n=1 Tax=Aspergillus avenaceus TaxID=36643 RepID=A0A5N6U219_ASPAV|nr:Scytalone dehydratase [Aspergillus avenaceus]